MGTDWLDAWTAALDDLELDVEAVESLLTGDHAVKDYPLTDRWQPPQGLGPLPLDLRPRADAVLARQITATAAIAQALTGNRQQAELLRRVDTARQPVRRPAFVDCAM